MNNNFLSAILESIFSNPKSSVTTIVGAIVFIVAKFGFEVPNEIQVSIIALTVWVLGLVTKDGDKPRN